MHGLPLDVERDLAASSRSGEVVSEDTMPNLWAPLVFLLDYSGTPSQLRPSKSRPLRIFRVPPHCLKKKGTSAARHLSRISVTHWASIGLAPGPDSPPTITQSIPARSKFGSGPSRGSSDK